MSQKFVPITATQSLLETLKSRALFSAVYFEQGKYDDCIEECNKAITLGREQMAGYKIIGK